MISFKVVENNLEPGTFYARFVPGDTVTLDDVIPDITEKTTLTEIDIKGVVLSLAKEVVKHVADGKTFVIDGLVTFTVSLSGKLTESDAVVNKDVITIKLIAHGDSTIQNDIRRQASLQRVGTTVAVPVVSTVRDAETGQTDSYTPGGIVQITGHNLKFDKNQADEGVFVNDGTTETRLNVYSLIGSTQVHALLPVTLGGNLTFAVRKRNSPIGDVYNSTHKQSVIQLTVPAP